MKKFYLIKEAYNLAVLSAFSAAVSSYGFNIEEKEDFIIVTLGSLSQSEYESAVREMYNLVFKLQDILGDSFCSHYVPKS